MIQIKNRNLQPLVEKHWSNVEKHFIEHTKGIKFKDIDSFCKKIDLNFSFEELIKLDYEKLKRIEKSYSEIKKLSSYKECSDKIKKIYIQNFSKSKKGLCDSKYSTIDLIDNLDIYVCPYCNRNYIDTREFEGEKKSGGQIDHFYNKNKYPLFALSFYNLIPVCPSCNHTKGIEQFHISPYDISYDTDKMMRFSWEPIGNSDYLQNKDCVKIIIEWYEKELENQFIKLKLTKPYAMHNDIVYGLIKRIKLYDNIKIKELKNDFPNLNFSREEILESLFSVGEDFKKVDYLKRPLSKLKNDIIMKELFDNQ